MIIFWTLAAGLIGLSLLFVALPLLRPAPETEAPDQDAINLEIFRRRLAELDADLAAGTLDKGSHESARRDLERDLLRNVKEGGSGARAGRDSGVFGRWILAFLLAGAVPTGAVLLYLELGSPALIERTAVAGRGAAQPTLGPNGETLPPLETLAQRLADRMAENPDDIQGWLMLGRTYFATGQIEAGLAAVRQAHDRAPELPDAMLAYAEALAFSRPALSFEGEPAQLIKRALEKDPEHVGGRWLDGMVAAERGQYQAAVSIWNRLLEGMDPAGEEAQTLRGMIADARRKGGLPEVEAAGTAPASSATAASATAPAATEAVPPTGSAPSGMASGTETAPGSQVAETGTAAPESAVGAVPVPAAPAPSASPAPVSAPSASSATVATANHAAAAPTPAAPIGGPGAQIVTAPPVAAPAPPAASAAPAVSPAASASQSAPALTVAVSLSEVLAARASPDDTVFVFVRAEGGPPMPLAARRLQVRDLPTRVLFDDSSAMIPAMRLSSVPRVTVSARVSRGGRAGPPQSGDMEGMAGPIATGGAVEVPLVIDRVWP